MRATIWGASGSLPSPASSATIRGKVKEALWAARERNFSTVGEVDAFLDTLPHSWRGTYHANTSCVHIEAGGGEILLCDAGSGLRDFALELPADDRPRVYHIFISHLHWDHIQGFPFFQPAYSPRNRIVFHGFHPELEDALRRQMAPPFFPVPFDAMEAAIEFDIRPENAVFSVDGVTVRTIRQNHPGASWGYRFEKNGASVVYSSDSEHGPDSRDQAYPFIEFFQDADVLIFDGQYTFEEASNEKRDWGHSNYRTAVELAARSTVDQLAVFHHEPSYTDTDIENIRREALDYRNHFNRQHGPGGTRLFPREIQFAYDGLVLEANKVQNTENAP